jgi:hypothetical protein
LRNADVAVDSECKIDEDSQDALSRERVHVFPEQPFLVERPRSAS